MTSPSNGQPATEEVSNCKPSRNNIPLPTISQAVALALVKGNIDGRTRHNVAGENASFYLTIYPEVLDSMWRRGGLGKKDVTTTSSDLTTTSSEYYDNIIGPYDNIIGPYDNVAYPLRRSGIKLFVSGGVRAVTMGDIS